MLEECTTRRNFVQGIVLGGAIASSTGAVMGTVGSSEDRTKELTKYIKYENPSRSGPKNPKNKEKVTEEVSRETWRRIHGLENAVDKILDRFRRRFNKPNDTTISVGVKKGSDHWTNRKLVVQQEIFTDRKGNKSRVENSGSEEAGPDDVSLSRLRSLVPNTATGRPLGKNEHSKITGIPVSVERQVKEKLCGFGDHVNSDYMYIPGGCMIEPTNGGGGGTVCTPASHDSKGDVMISAGHVLDNGDEFTQGGSDAQLGQGVAKKPPASNIDTGYLEPINGANLEWTLSDDNGGYQYVIQGDVSWSWVDQLQANEETIYSQGATTGIDSGIITKHNKTYDGVWEVNFTADADNGDSGGPVYLTESGSSGAYDNCYIIGYNSATVSNPDGECPNEKSEAIHITWAKDELNLS